MGTEAPVGSLVDFLDGLFPPEAGVAGRVCAIGARASAPLFAEEETAVARAVESRREAFRTGRALAREALQTFGVSPAALPVGPSRAPVWPAGFVGSISHTAKLCAVAVARRDAVRGLGLDLELTERWDPTVADHVTTDDERAQAGDDAFAAPWPLVVFSVKESLFKCLHPIVGQFFGFQDVELRLARGGGLAASLARSAPPALSSLATLLPTVRLVVAVRAAHVVTSALV